MLVAALLTEVLLGASLDSGGRWVEVVLGRGMGILMMGRTAGGANEVTVWEVMGRDVTNLAGANEKESKKLFKINSTAFAYWCLKCRIKDKRELGMMCRTLHFANCRQFWSHEHMFWKDPIKNLTLIEELAQLNTCSPSKWHCNICSVPSGVKTKKNYFVVA